MMNTSITLRTTLEYDDTTLEIRETVGKGFVAVNWLIGSQTRKRLPPDHKIALFVLTKKIKIQLYFPNEDNIYLYFLTIVHLS